MNSSAWTQSLIVKKTFLFQAFQFFQTVLIQAILFCISIVFIYKQLNVKTVIFRTVQFNISTQFKYQNNSILSNSV